MTFDQAAAKKISEMFEDDTAENESESNSQSYSIFPEMYQINHRKYLAEFQFEGSKSFMVH